MLTLEKPELHKLSWGNDGISALMESNAKILNEFDELRLGQFKQKIIAAFN
ncbi:hypothetical protein [Psychrosphaera algicola]|uniref:Uncharacterized protein n=1 Tax=Psychrosphaera algicola TaxID=3023714 RepID=A0ABT5FGZ9_9GAMM|nr:hypothetical protein [Psychrosphaera sp. G1-22]MDC2890361.1 hypothetical protein [Psychrosphaera sp. G1-22]